MSVHYKFKSSLDFDTITFDGLHISVQDLKKSIFQQKNIGKNTDFDLLITNAQTKEEYKDENVLIPKNTSLIVSRVPLANQSKRGSSRGGVNQQLQTSAKLNIDSNSQDGTDQSSFKLSTAVDLSRLDASEDDKIRAMMTQSTLEYDPSNYQRIRGANQVGPTPPQYRCYKCQKTGHWIKDCPLKDIQETPDIKKSTGIPRSFMVPVEGPQVPGAMMTPGGTFAVPAIDHQAYKEVKKERPPFAAQVTTEPEKPEIPEDLLCGMCKDLLSDAVLMPCCGDSFCDECIRTALLESDDQECPACGEKEISPETLVPSRYLRNSVANFGNQTGYRKPERLPPVQPAPPPQPAPAQASAPAPAPTPAAAAPPPVKLPTPPPAFVPPSEDLPPGETEPLSQSDHRSSSHPDSYPSQSSEQEPDSSPPGSGIPVLGAPSIRRSGQDGDRHSGSLHPRGHNHMSSTQSAEGSRHHPGEGRRPRHYPHRRSTEERPGTPTIDERNLESSANISHSHNLAPVHSAPSMTTRPPNLPDVSVPPPGMGPPTTYHNIQPIGSQGPTMNRDPAPYNAYDSKDGPENQFPRHRGGREDWSGRCKSERHLYREWARHSSRVRGPPDRSYGQQRVRDLDQSSGNTGYPVTTHNSITVCQPPAAGGYYDHEPPSSYSSAPHSDKYGGGSYRGGYRPRQRGGSGFRGNGPRPVSNVIDDPLEAFERILREKDRSRKLRRRSRSRSRSYSRSRSRSRSHSPRPRTRTRSRSIRRSLSRSPPPRKGRSFSRSRSRTPPPRRSRSRSRSISRIRRSLTPRRSRSPRPFRSKRSRTRSRSISRTPRSRSRSFSISKSRSRSRSFSRSISPRDRRPLSPRHGDRDGPLRLRTQSRSPPRFRGRYGDPPPLQYFDVDFPYNRGGGRGMRGRRPFPPGVGAPMGGPPPGPPPSFRKDYDGPRDNYRHPDPVGASGTHPHASRFPDKRYDQKPRLKPPPLGPPGRHTDLSAPPGVTTDGPSDHSDTFSRPAPFSGTDSYHPPPGPAAEYRRVDPPRDDWEKERRRVRERQTTPPPPGTRDLTPPGGWDRDRDRPRERSRERSVERPRDRSRDRSRERTSRERTRERSPERQRERPKSSPERPRERDDQTSHFKERDRERDLPPRDREVAPPGVRERDNRDRDVPPPGVDPRERRERDFDQPPEKDRERERDRERDRDKERDIGPPGDFERRERDSESHRVSDRERERDGQYRERERGIDTIVRDRDIKPRGPPLNARDRDVPPPIPLHPQPMPLLANPQPYPLHPPINQAMHPGMHHAALRMWEMNPLLAPNMHDREYPPFDPREWDRDRRDIRGRDRDRSRGRDRGRERDRERDRDRNREHGREHGHYREHFQSSPDSRKDRRARTPSKERSKDRSKDHNKEASNRYSSSNKKSGRDQSKESKDDKHKQADSKRRTSSPEHKEKVKKEEAKEKKSKEKKKKKKSADEDGKKKKKRKEKKTEVEKESKREKSPVEEKLEVSKEEVVSPVHSTTETVTKAEAETTEVKPDVEEEEEDSGTPIVEENDGAPEELNTTVESEPPKTPEREEPILISDQENPPEEPSPAKSAEMLAPLPEPSKWELEEEGSSSAAYDVSSSQETESASANAKVTSEVIKRAENAIFHKAISSIRTIEPVPKKAERKVYHVATAAAEKEKKTTPDVQIVENPPDREARETNNTITVTFPTRTEGNGDSAVDSKPKTNVEKSTISPIRVPAKERLGSRIGEEEPKIESVRRVIRNRSRSSSRDRSRHHRTDRKSLKSSAVPVERPRTPSPQYRGRDPRHRTPSPQYRGRDSKRERSREEKPRSRSRDARVLSRVKVKDSESEARSPERRKIKEIRKKRQSRSSSREHKKKKKDKKHRKDRKKKDKKDSRRSDSSGDETEEKEGEEKKPEAVAQKEETASSEGAKKVQRKNPRLASDRRKSVLDESNFEPNYDASSSGESDQDEPGPAGDVKADQTASSASGVAKSATAQSTTAGSPAAKRPASPAKSPDLDRKRAKLEENSENGKKDKTKKKRAKMSSSSESESSSKEESSSDGSSSESSEDSSVKKRKKKKKKAKKRKAKKKSKKKKIESSSESASDSDGSSSSESDVREKRKKKHRRPKKSSKKKKSKHK